VKTQGKAFVTQKRKQTSGTNATAIFLGDVVKMIAAGGVTAAAAGGSFYSVSQGASYLDAGGNRVLGPYLPASTASSTTYDSDAAAFIFCVDNMAETVFESVQAGTTAIATLTNLELYSDMVAGTGTTTNGISGHTLSSGVGTSVANWRIIDYPRRADNDLTLATTKAWCIAAELQGYQVGVTWTV